MGNLRCRWVRDRLPLLVGDELRGLDRRRVERHLIGCLPCRQHQASLGEALGALRTVAATVATPPDAPSLWPALARQIRESHRPAPTPAFAVPFAWIFAKPWPVLGFGLGLGLLAAVGVGLGVRRKIDVAQAHIAANARPIQHVPAAPRPRLVALPTPRPQPLPSHELPVTVEAPVVESNSPAATPIRDFDLEHGRLMSPEAREPRDTKNTY